MTAHELAKQLLDGPDVAVTVSVDVSTCCENAGHRVHGYFDGSVEEVYIEDFGPIGRSPIMERILCVDGTANFTYIGELNSDQCECEACSKTISKNAALLEKWRNK